MPQWLLGRWAFLVIGAVVGLAIGYGASGQLDKDKSSTRNEVTAQASPVVQEEESPTVEPEPEFVLPSPEDVQIGIKILEKTCFGSAGCNITFRIDPSFTGVTSIPDDMSIEVIYEVRGGEDGPQVNTFTVTSGTAEFDREEFLSTSSESAKLTATATEVLEG